jgi:hypothetical protein
MPFCWSPIGTRPSRCPRDALTERTFEARSLSVSAKPWTLTSALVESLDPKTRDDLRRVLIRDQADRDAISSRRMRYRDQDNN